MEAVLDPGHGEEGEGHAEDDPEVTPPGQRGVALSQLGGGSRKGVEEFGCGGIHFFFVQRLAIVDPPRVEQIDLLQHQL